MATAVYPPDRMLSGGLAYGVPQQSKGLPMNDMTPIRTGTRQSPVRDRRWLILSTLCLGVLIAQVDTSVVNLAMQPIGATFRSSVPALQWVLDAYNLSYATLLLSGGLIADLYGRRLAFQLGAAILTVASVACAFAPSVRSFGWSGPSSQRGVARSACGQAATASPS
jgi:MFS family permease